MLTLRPLLVLPRLLEISPPLPFNKLLDLTVVLEVVTDRVVLSEVRRELFGGVATEPPLFDLLLLSRHLARWLGTPFFFAIGGF